VSTPTSIPDALLLLADLGAPPRLVQHHRLVAEAAAEVLSGLPPQLRAAVRQDIVLVGAALHDAGKIVHPSELTSPGARHEKAGELLLLERGVDRRLARCCVTHADWRDARAELEDRLVAVADKLWKGKRDPDLEQWLIGELASSAGAAFWDVYPILSDLFDRVAGAGDERLSRS
jgi:hypothetical protein